MHPDPILHLTIEARNRQLQLDERALERRRMIEDAAREMREAAGDDLAHGVRSRLGGVTRRFGWAGRPVSRGSL